ncbi:RNA polymerase sigma factor SigX [Clostridium ihumii]|uniref:RNA polymerase sigma factor SigX n=1 Tax=Clostridium ihumii TaxID=1470356 RepID=UPI00059069FF|nr:RNA polymerase sigma factor SigX [Clostridium ihumii]
MIEAFMEFEELFKEYYVYVVKQVMQIVKNQTIAEDLSQEVFMQLYKINWKEIENITGWLNKSAIYVSYNYLRSEKRHKARVEKAGAFMEEQDIQALEETFIRKEEIENVRNVMDKLKEQDKKLLLLRYSGLKYKEIAEILQIESANIGTMLVRAQKKFRDLYKENWR